MRRSRLVLVAVLVAASHGCKRDAGGVRSGAKGVRIVAEESDISTFLAGEPDGSRIARAASDGVTVVSGGQTHTVVREAALLLEWSPRGDLLALGFAARDRAGAGGPGVARVEVWHVGATKASRRWSGEANAFAWSPDGTSLAIAADGAVWSVEVATGARTRVGEATGGPPMLYAPRLAFAPDGASLAVADEKGLRVLALSGTGSLSLVVPEASEESSIVPFWSSDSRRLGAAIFPLSGGPAHAGPGRARVWTIASAGYVKDFGEIDYPWDFEPAFSPDGASIALASTRAGRRTLLLRTGSGPDVPVADLGPDDRSTRVRWLSGSTLRVDGGPRVIEVTIR